MKEIGESGLWGSKEKVVSAAGDNSWKTCTTTSSIRDRPVRVVQGGRFIMKKKETRTVPFTRTLAQLKKLRSGSGA